MSTSKSKGDDARVNSVRENSIYISAFLKQLLLQKRLHFGESNPNFRSGFKLVSGLMVFEIS